MIVERVRTVDSALVTAFARLLPQLSSAPPPGPDVLAAILAQPGTALVVARADSEILGALTLTIYRIPTGVQARIDDVVVDGAARGRGIGAALSREAIAIARGAGARAVTLTSRPSRQAANRLYQRLGFTPVETNVYRLSL